MGIVSHVKVDVDRLSHYLIRNVLTLNRSDHGSKHIYLDALELL